MNVSGIWGREGGRKDKRERNRKKEKERERKRGERVGLTSSGVNGFNGFGGTARMEVSLKLSNCEY